MELVSEDEESQTSHVVGGLSEAVNDLNLSTVSTILKVNTFSNVEMIVKTLDKNDLALTHSVSLNDLNLISSHNNVTSENSTTPSSSLELLKAAPSA